MAKLADSGGRILIAELNRGNVSQSSPHIHIISGLADQHPAYGIDRLQFSFGTNYIAPLALIDITGTK